MMSDGQGFASASSSVSCSSSRTRVEQAGSATHCAQRAQLLAFAARAPHLDAEGGGRLDVGTCVLKGVNVLIVEDDFIVAFDMQMLLEDRGATAIGPASSLEEARALIADRVSDIHVAVLDVNINGQYVFPIAVELRRARIPFVFATAYADDDRLFPDDLKGVARLAKPVLPNALVGQLKRLLG